VEPVLSGPGLVNIYSWLKETGASKEPPWLAKRLQQEDPAKVISQTALKGSVSLATHALRLFVSVLGSVCGNLALVGMTTGGLYLGGGICPKILPELKRGDLLRAFADKGRFKELLVKIPVKVILNPEAALLGAAHHAAQTGKSLPT
jgi:glucokinase